MTYQPWTLEGSDGQAILGDTHLPTTEPTGVLVLCHGFKGYKDYGFFPQLAQRAADAGLIAHRFNFSHSGMTNHIETFERADLFERDTWGKQIEDLTRVIEQRACDAGLPIVVFGHSRGGLTALLTAAKLGERLAGVVSVALPDEPCSLDEDQRAMLKRVGKLPSPSSRTGQTLYVGRDWLDEIEADPQAFDPVKAVATLRIPVQMIHGDEDTTVSPDAAYRLASAAGVMPLIVKGAGHTFNASNPLRMDSTPPVQTIEMFDAVLAFAKRVIA